MRRQSLGVLALVLLATSFTLAQPALAAGHAKKKNLAAIVHLRYWVDHSNDNWVGVPKLDVSPKRVFLCYRDHTPARGENCPTKIFWIVESGDPLADLTIDSVAIATDPVTGKNNGRLFDLSLGFSNTSGTDDYNSLEAEVNEEPKWDKKRPENNKVYEKVGYTVTATIGGNLVTVDPEIIIQKPGG